MQITFDDEMYKTQILSNRYQSLSTELADCTKKWVQVGRVRNMCLYPMFAGKAMDLPVCQFDLCGLSAINNNCQIQNHMFIIYNQKTKHKYEETCNPVLSTLEIIPMSNHIMLLKASGMHELILDLMKIQESFQIIPYYESLNHKHLVELRCLDCGKEAAEWVSRCLDKPDLRLGFNKPGSMMRELYWNQFGQLYSLNGKDRESMVCYAELPNCTLVSERSHTIINEKLSQFIHMRQFIPNIIVTPYRSSPFFEINWEWIKIGDAVIRNINPWGRYSDIEPKNLPIDLVIQLMTLTCNVYLPGEMRIGNTVYIRVNDDSNEID
ncbi:mitochondrial amidoxime reducing component 2-like [Harpegnathos saltator]|uniref:mitochondrial amidoxime reducing component 2-like n=1 Tax=Harpegnathos saltator TaxID=610380 RepID=UPI00058D6AB1|nr:mitochondrial amidoxime reducing component 2-like [Harpegnathos saltator]